MEAAEGTAVDMAADGREINVNVSSCGVSHCINILVVAF